MLLKEGNGGGPEGEMGDQYAGDLPPDVMENPGLLDYPPPLEEVSDEQAD